MKLSSAFSVGPLKASSDFNSSDNPMLSANSWVVILILGIMCTTFFLASETMSLAFVTPPLVVMLGSLFGTRFRTQVAIGCLPLLIGAIYAFSDEDSFISAGVGGGPIGLYFANQLLFTVFASGSKRRSWLTEDGTLTKSSYLLILGLSFYISFNTDLSQGSIGFGIDPRPFLLILYLLIGYTLRRNTQFLFILLLLSTISLLAQNLRIGYDSDMSLFFDFLGRLTYADIGFVLSLCAALLCGRVIKRHQNKSSKGHYQEGLFVGATAVLIAVNGLYITLKATISQPQMYFLGDQTFSDPKWIWPAYDDHIIRIAKQGVYSIDSIAEFSARFDFDTSLGVAICLFTIGYIWHIKGALLVSAFWIATYVFHLIVLYDGSAFGALHNRSYVDLFLVLFDGGYFIMELSNPSTLLAPKVQLAESYLKLGPDFIFCVFGVWSGLLFRVGRSGLQLRKLPVFQRGLLQSNSPVNIALVSIGITVLSFFVLRIVFFVISMVVFLNS